VISITYSKGVSVALGILHA